MKMRLPSKEIVERLKTEYPIGIRVELVKMDDVQAPPIGTKGTVKGVDDTASIMVRWDNGSGLHIVYGEDHCKKLQTVETTCDGTTDVWDSREDALAFFLEAMMNTEGSERDRYTNIYTKLIMGKQQCSDEE